MGFQPFSMILLGFCLLSSFTSTALPTASSSLDSIPRLESRTPSAKNKTIVQLFQWNWKSVAEECTNFLGPFGYGYAQVSPPQEAITGTQWWTDYQPVSYQIQGKRGNRDDFQSMVSTCQDAGVGIIVDAVFNHMTAGSGTGTAGSSYTKYSYDAVPYTSDDFHYCAGDGKAAGITDYTNQTNVWDCELEGLADLKSEASNVQSTIAGYLSDLNSNLSVQGFRVDAAKHQNPDNIKSILKTVNDDSLYITQEVIWGAGEASQPSMYTDIGDVQMFHGTTDLQRMFTSDGIAFLSAPNPFGEGWGDGYVASSSANLFVANHDTERGGSSLNAQSENNAYVLANIFLLGWNYGTPTVLSGYNYSNTDDGPAQDSNGNTQDTNCDQDGWRCEHRWAAIANMVGFRNAVGDSAIANNITDGDQRVAFGRGEVGFVAINNQGDTWTNTFSTGLPDNKYCDIIHATISGTTVDCGTTITVSDGSFQADIAAYDAVALYAGGP